MTSQHTLPPRAGSNYEGRPHAYDPVTQPQLFDGVIGKRIVAFLIDACIIFILLAVAFAATIVLTILTLGLAALLLQLHPVGGGGALVLARGDGAGELDGAAVEEELLGERGLAGVGVRDDGERAAFGDFGGEGHW